ncbi:hypothetical protein AB0425_13660 [Actinosynnema sp. NPDC051121]
MAADDAVTGRQASIGGVGSRVVLRILAVACWLSAVGVTITVFAGGMPWWAGVLVELACLVVILPIGVALWFDATQHKEDTERLLRTGRPAVAEVVELEMVDPGDGSADVAVLRLRISGAGVPPFEATYRGRGDDEFRPGALLHATVDPADNLFALGRLHVRRRSEGP